MIQYEKLGRTFVLPSRTGELSFVHSYPPGENEITITRSRTGVPLAFGDDHNEDVLTTDYFIRHLGITAPPIKGLVDAHGEIFARSSNPDSQKFCLRGSWMMDANDLDQIDTDHGLFWFYRMYGSPPPGSDGRSYKINDYHNSGIPVNAICIDGLLADPIAPDALSMMAYLESLIRDTGLVLGTSIDCDAGMYPSPSSWLPHGRNMKEYLKMAEKMKVYEVDLMRKPFMRALVRMSRFVGAFKSSEYCYPEYAEYQEKRLLEV